MLCQALVVGALHAAEIWRDHARGRSPSTVASNGPRTVRAAVKVERNAGGPPARRDDFPSRASWVPGLVPQPSWVGAAATHAAAIWMEKSKEAAINWATSERLATCLDSRLRKACTRTFHALTIHLRLFCFVANGTLLPGRCRLYAQMGPSGCGKTTLFDVLACRKTAGRTSGTLLLGHQPLTTSVARQLVGYVEQFGEQHLPHLGAWLAWLRVSEGTLTCRAMSMLGVLQLVNYLFRIRF